MNRTNEYKLIIKNTYIPQIKTPTVNLTKYLEFINLKEKVQKLTKKEIIYLKSIENKINEFQINEYEFLSSDDKKNYENIKNYISKEIIRFKLKIRGYLNDHDDNNKLSYKNNDINKLSHNNRMSYKIDDCTNNTEDNRTGYKNIGEYEQSQEIIIKNRKQEYLSHQISELGQIMSDISLHINIQGEALERIDDVIIKSDNLIDRTVIEIEKTWRNIRDRRKTIFKFLIFWIILIFIYWFLRR